MRRVRIVVWLMVAAALGVISWMAFFAPEPEIQPVRIGGPFSMVNQDGQAVTEKDFAGKAMAMFFGFTFCPDICPTTLVRLTALMAGLGSDSAKVQVILVSVDPERDAPQVLKEYLRAFDSRFVGLTGTPDQLAALARNYRIYYKKVPDASGGYTMDHSAGVFLFDTKGEFRGTLDTHEADDSVIAKLKRLLAS